MTQHWPGGSASASAARPGSRSAAPALTSGIFKFRSTPSGTLPTDADILRTITNGLHTTFMPRWAPLTPIERSDLVQYVKSLSPRFKEEQQHPRPRVDPVRVGPRPSPCTPWHEMQ